MSEDVPAASLGPVLLMRRAQRWMPEGFSIEPRYPPEWLGPLMVTYQRLESYLLQEGAVALLPPDLDPEVIAVGAMEVVRVPGLAAPMVAIPAAKHG